MELNQKKLIDLNFLKIIGILLVVLGHSTILYTNEWVFQTPVNSTLFKHLANYIYSFHMPLYVFISGVIFCYTENRYKTLTNLISKKLKRLIIPYILVGTFYMIPIRMIVNYYGNDSYIYLLIHNLILSNDAGHLWYLTTLFNIFIIIYCINKVAKTSIHHILIIIALLLLHELSKGGQTIFQYDRTLLYLIYFYVGYLFMEYKNNIDNICNRINNLFIFAFITHILLMLISTVFNSYKSYIAIKLFLHIINMLIPFVGIMSVYLFVNFILKYNPKIVENKFYKILDKHNFMIYLFHEPIIFIILTYFSNISPFLLVPLCFFTALLVSLSISIFIKILKPKILKRKELMSV